VSTRNTTYPFSGGYFKIQMTVTKVDHELPGEITSKVDDAFGLFMTAVAAAGGVLGSRYDEGATAHITTINQTVTVDNLSIRFEIEGRSQSKGVCSGGLSEVLAKTVAVSMHDIVDAFRDDESPSDFIKDLIKHFMENRGDDPFGSGGPFEGFEVVDVTDKFFPGRRFGGRGSSSSDSAFSSAGRSRGGTHR